MRLAHIVFLWRGKWPSLKTSEESTFLHFLTNIFLSNIPQQPWPLRRSFSVLQCMLTFCVQAFSVHRIRRNCDRKVRILCLINAEMVSESNKPTHILLLIINTCLQQLQPTCFLLAENKNKKRNMSRVWLYGFRAMLREYTHWWQTESKIKLPENWGTYSLWEQERVKEVVGEVGVVWDWKDGGAVEWQHLKLCASMDSAAL